MRGAYIRGPKVRLHDTAFGPHRDAGDTRSIVHRPCYLGRLRTRYARRNGPEPHTLAGRGSSPPYASACNHKVTCPVRRTPWRTGSAKRWHVGAQPGFHTRVRVHARDCRAGAHATATYNHMDDEEYGMR